MNPTVAWVILSSVGFVLSIYLTVQSWHDIRALDNRLNGRRFIARSRFAREGLRVTVHWAWLLLGISVLIGAEISWRFVGALLYGNVILVVNSLIDARSRAAILARRES